MSSSQNADHPLVDRQRFGKPLEGQEGGRQSSEQKGIFPVGREGPPERRNGVLVAPLGGQVGADLFERWFQGRPHQRAENGAEPSDIEPARNPQFDARGGRLAATPADHQDRARGEDHHVVGMAGGVEPPGGDHLALLEVEEFHVADRAVVELAVEPAERFEAACKVTRMSPPGSAVSVGSSRRWARTKVLAPTRTRVRSSSELDDAGGGGGAPENGTTRVAVRHRFFAT